MQIFLLKKKKEEHGCETITKTATNNKYEHKKIIMHC